MVFHKQKNAALRTKAGSNFFFLGGGGQEDIGSFYVALAILELKI